MAERSGRRRPPWWPEDESWPPNRRPRFGRTFGRRVVIGVLAFVLLMAVINAVSYAVFGPEHDQDGPPAPFFLGFFVLVVVLLALGAGRVARRFARPVGEVLDAVESLSAGDYSMRVALSGPADVRELAASFNRLAERLQSLEEQRRNLVADVSHELRTPLSVLRGNLEGIVDGVYEPEPARLQLLIDEVQVIARLIDDFQTLSQAEAGALQLHAEPGNLAAVVRATAAAFASRAASAGVELTASAATGPEFSFDAVRVREVLENLVANALRHTPAGGRITLGLRWSSDAAVITVTDTGSGIAPEDLPYVFERYRKSPDSTGQGLGLPIARRLVEAHGGQLTAESASGAGTTFTVMLPLGE